MKPLNHIVTALLAGCLATAWAADDRGSSSRETEARGRAAEGELPRGADSAHDATDDKGGRVAGTRNGADDGASHDAGDDHGGRQTRGRGADDGAQQGRADNHGGRSGSSATSGSSSSSASSGSSGSKGGGKGGDDGGGGRSGSGKGR
ncbi:hypothetical protein JHS3_30510 [Jeongeupia sp. HS-3]|uniref:hypothetical protein n=1 Tax=Jeongeupia sp. HS-3 TaxID=1009682 RepID=UPI0018A444BA|nr:hypothetical protein [Jeongeupia sp. HS-3]BCL77315.1 hypothetical protein JHS3_30510 [Jeongeupia sp. HS-3]